MSSIPESTNGQYLPKTRKSFSDLKVWLSSSSDIFQMYRVFFIKKKLVSLPIKNIFWGSDLVLILIELRERYLHL